MTKERASALSALDGVIESGGSGRRTASAIIDYIKTFPTADGVTAQEALEGMMDEVVSMSRSYRD